MSMSSLIAFNRLGRAAPPLVIGALSYFAVPEMVTLTPLVLFIAALLVATSDISSTHTRWRSITLAFLASVAGSSLAYGGSSVKALSSAGQSIVAQILFSCITTATSLVPILINNTFFHKHGQMFSSSSTAILIFPALQVTGNVIVAHSSPLGRLGVWSPIQGIQGYRWMLPYFGAASQDWITGLWAILLASHWELVSPISQEQDSPKHKLVDVEDHPEAVSPNYLIEYDGNQIAPTHRTAAQTTETRSSSSSSWTAAVDNKVPKKLLSFTLLALVLTLPSFFLPPGATGSSLPLPSDSFSASPLVANIALGCILPTEPNLNSPKAPSGAFDSYLAETKRFGSRGSIFLWPEGAVTFENENERKKDFNKSKRFKDADPDTGGGDPTRGKYRSGLAVIGPSGVELEYYKNRLVPFSESYSYTSHGRAHYPLQITSSICLDLAHPGTLLSLPSQPELILAPASVWTTQMSQAMFEEAHMRANEVGSLLLWCDGSPKGVSGVVGQGQSGSEQVGRGSFIKNVSIRLRGDGKEAVVIEKTLYARGGDVAILILVWGLCGLGPLGTSLIGMARALGARASTLSALGYLRNGAQLFGESIRHNYRVLLDRVSPSSGVRVEVPNLMD
ncbi:uncharacterized protein EI90DRAFT_3041146 [Cantharellus anzutake]|uniref:uncharacterized protein n=1 Tax=Cantharellus anzutake TaxID=1750568 RepID=UPI0019034CFD|nr:uncharacterized protein EI90DRAFT_3041146 [Cantharellus anzutake]KAF8337953.1 hypothetical protein EI90DRAFT_3041146 [Cantharellus anzutake]